jgi:GH15 family glucan-1,4-alpha-glucosidase
VAHGGIGNVTSVGQRDAGAPSQLQIISGLSSERRLSEWEVEWLPAYEGSRPVRVGNAAHGQLQLEVFGEVLDALHQARHGGLHAREADWAFQSAVLEHLETVWDWPDEDIWAVRGPRQHFTYSKVMAWIALDRGVRAIETLRLEAGTLASAAPAPPR